jgi:hypothetical protein
MVCLTTLSADLQLQGSEIARNVSDIGLLNICFKNSLIGVKETTTSVPVVVLHQGFKTGQLIKRRREA